MNSYSQYKLEPEVYNSFAKRAWNSGFSGGMGKRAWNSGFTGKILLQKIYLYNSVTYYELFVLWILIHDFQLR